MPIKHIPVRSCIACGIKVDKHRLVRLVKSSDQSVLVDYTYMKAGRGAYICDNSSCWEVALRRKAINYHLRVPPSATDMIRNESGTVPLGSKQL